PPGGSDEHVGGLEIAVQLLGAVDGEDALRELAQRGAEADEVGGARGPRPPPGRGHAAVLELVAGGGSAGVPRVLPGGAERRGGPGCERGIERRSGAHVVEEALAED